MLFLTDIVESSITLDQAYFNFTVGAAFVAGAIVIICVTLNSLTKNRKKQQNMLDELEKRINLRRRILSDTQSNAWRSTGKEIEFTEDCARQHGVKMRMTLDEFASYIHHDSQESWRLLQEYHETLGRKSVKLFIKTPRDQEWHWFKVSYNTSTDDQVFAYNGIFTCIDEEIKMSEKARQLQNILKQRQQEFYFMYGSIPAMKRLMTQIYRSAATIMKSNPALDEEKMKKANDTLHQSADYFRKLTHTLASRKINT